VSVGNRARLGDRIHFTMDIRMRDPLLARKVRGEGDRQASRLTGLIRVFIAPEDDLQLVRVDGDSSGTAGVLTASVSSSIGRP
jgi:hypothetical protein